MNECDESEFEELLEKIDVIKETGLTLSPMIPSRHMCIEGAKTGKITPETAREIYMAMINASKDFLFTNDKVF